VSDVELFEDTCVHTMDSGIPYCSLLKLSAFPRTVTAHIFYRDIMKEVHERMNHTVFL